MSQLVEGYLEILQEELTNYQKMLLRSAAYGAIAGGVVSLKGRQRRSRQYVKRMGECKKKKNRRECEEEANKQLQPPLRFRDVEIRAAEKYWKEQKNKKKG